MTKEEVAHRLVERISRAQRFTTIVADPPWPYATPGKGPLQSSKEHRPKSFDYSRDGETAGSSASSRYGLMTMDAIKALGVQRHAADNAHLYLWTTNGFIVEAHEVAKAWGFRPITLITWTKVMKDDPATPSMKTGFYFRGATEHVVFAVRGSLKLQTARGVSTDAVRYTKPKTMWASWCERCGQFNSASTLRSDVLTDCSFCPPNTLTEAIEYEPVYRPATRPAKVVAKKTKPVRPIRGETTER